MSQNITFTVSGIAECVLPVKDSFGREILSAISFGPDNGEVLLKDALGKTRFKVTQTGDDLGSTEISDAHGVVRFEAQTEQGDGGGTKIRDEDGNEVIHATRGVVRLKIFQVAQLPEAENCGPGYKAMVNDALNPCVLKTAVGGGSFVAPVFCDGLVWRIG